MTVDTASGDPGAGASDPGQPAATPPPSRGRVRWGWIVIGFLLLLAAVALSILFAPPSNFITAQLQKAVHNATGQDLKVESSSYVIRNTVSIELNGVSYGPPGAKPGETLLTARSLRTSIPLQALWDQKLDLTAIDLEAPVLNLVRKDSGATNWTPAAAPAATAPATAPQTESAPPAAGDAAGLPKDVPAILGLPPTTIRNGTLIYSDEKAGTALRLDTIDARIAMDPKYGGAAAQGSVRYNNEPVTFDLTVADAAAAFGGKSSAMGLTLDGRMLKAKLAGEGAIGELPMLAGEIEAASPSARELATWLGLGDSIPAGLGSLTFKGRADGATGRTSGAGVAVIGDAPVTYDMILENIRDALSGQASPLTGKFSAPDLNADLSGKVSLGGSPAFEGDLDASTPAVGKLIQKLAGQANAALASLGPGKLKGKAKLSGQSLSFADTAFEADGKSGTFTGDIALAGPRPKISGALDVALIDVDALTGRTPAAAATLEAIEDTAPSDGYATTWDALLAELDEIENPPVPAAQLEAAPAAAWSTAPIDLSALRTVDLDLAVTARKVRYGTLDIKDAKIATKLDNGELAARIDDVKVGAGSGTGLIDIKARGTQHAAAMAIKLKGVEAEPLTYELSGKPLLKGASDVDINTSATGKSLNQLVSTLDGGARFDMKQGKLRGWDIGKMVEELWNYKGWGFNPQRVTPFDKLTANYVIKKGTMKSAPDLNFRGPTAGVKSVGDVIVPQRMLDQELEVQNLICNISIQGDWTKKLNIGPRCLSGIGKLFGVSMESAPPAANAPPPPPEVKARLEKALAAPAAESRLTPAQRAFLKSLLPAEAPATP